MDILKLQLVEKYKSFIDSNQDFKVVYGDNLLDSQNDVILVLDSSFNPPHMGHYSLAKRSIEYFKEHHKNSKVSLLLLLSVKNADKVPTPASFEERLYMMCLLNDFIKKDGIKVSVGLTTHAKFVDKSDAIRRACSFENQIAYLVGFDTITRIFDPRYYKPDAPADALQEFMKTTQFCCLTRDNGSIPSEEQLNYASDISSGKFEPLIPSHWGSKIHILDNDSKYTKISSSDIRNKLHNISRVKELNDELPLTIMEYLEVFGKSIY
ncbi:hypothetical protein TPHA_0E03820 [Tetrapisispora phaffii CBS 4417]|uniref:Cytidyltransferase-like domain-containing protein n=1 Tax=Tetrapisispora phaffii (strain ATCC 24235 / CBS 4417 / NBRC 1672 / NRRL Y-8282 / UCD 70-5) TaxID=1071381 RepID=G8BU93_TETPH|nr:hypothetical protein TPHA_0E03820 [Tetrapisispora phaffii CBS 4417]CCE63471.1 hypothetical protein TPHA_0E03820 [Tetrapisispora phaffii CBS 4417]